VEEYEEDIVSLYVNGMRNKIKRLCTEISNICDENYVEDDEDDSDNSTNTDTDHATSSTEDFSFEAKDEL